jgi:hypothetical protein
VFFVGNAVTGATDAANYGKSPATPYATWDYAINAATASNGDVIYLMPGHEETIINATTIVPDKAGLTHIGLGRGGNRPIINFNHANAKIIVSGANQHISNLIFNATITAVVLGVTVTGHDVEIDKCLWTWETTASDFVSALSVVAADRCNIHDNVWITENTAGAASAISLNDSEDTTIQRNTFRGVWSGAVIFATGVLSSRLLVLDNVIYNGDDSVYNAIDTGSLSTTGIVANNTITSMYTQAGALAKLIRIGDLTWHNNTFANDVSEHAVGNKDTTLVPATSST